MSMGVKESGLEEILWVFFPHSLNQDIFIWLRVEVWNFKLNILFLLSSSYIDDNTIMI